MKRLKIMKAYAVLWLFIYFLVNSNMEAMETFFFATLTFNLAVLTVLVIGIIVIMKASVNLVMLAGTFGTLAYKKDNISFYLQGIEKIMPANIAHMFHSRAEKGVLLFTSEESRAVVEWIDEKFSNQNRYVNYFIGTALMIGLLGTFTGLLVAIDQMGKIILSLSGDIDLGEVIRSFAGPLGGMATGFGSSLFGVISAIILGLMGYILNKNQEVLIEGVEDWLKGRIIDAGPSTSSAAAVPGEGAGGDLPEHRSSFIDVFIDNIAALTREMAKISQTNERLHSITIASVQQAHDEHETNYELFENINDNLKSINTSTQESSSILQDKLLSIENAITSTNQTSLEELKSSMQTLAQSITQALDVNADKINIQSQEVTKTLQILDAKLASQLEALNTISQEQHEANELLKVDTAKASLEAIKSELQTIATLLSSNEENETQNFKDMLESLNLVSQKLQEEMTLLESLEKLSKVSINDGRKQSEVLSKVNKGIQEVSDSVSSASTRTTNILDKKIASIESLLDTQTQKQEESVFQTAQVTQHLEEIQKTISTSNDLETKAFTQAEETKELLEKQRELLNILVGKNDENLNELRRISSAPAGSASSAPRTTQTEESSGFFSNFFK